MSELSEVFNAHRVFLHWTSNSLSITVPALWLSTGSHGSLYSWVSAQVSCTPLSVSSFGCSNVPYVPSPYRSKKSCWLFSFSLVVRTHIGCLPNTLMWNWKLAFYTYILRDDKCLKFITLVCNNDVIFYGYVLV